jgi:prefoldin subunit 5
MPRDMQIQALERQAGYIRSALDEIQKRLEELRSAHAAETGDKK